MKKLILFAIIIASLLVSCSNSKTFTKSDGSEFTAMPYGWGNSDVNKVEGVKYKLNIPDVVLSCLFCETLVVPILVTAFDVWEPVFYDVPKTSSK